MTVPENRRVSFQMKFYMMAAGFGLNATDKNVVLFMIMAVE